MIPRQIEVMLLKNDVLKIVPKLSEYLFEGYFLSLPRDIHS